jgi:AraC-like DNA-binding protein
MIQLDTRSTAERKIVDFRPLRIHGALVLGRYHYTGAHPGLPFHQHDHMLEISYLAKGEQTYRVGREDFQLRGGDVFLTFPNEPHGTGRIPEQRGDLYWLLVDMTPATRQPFLGCEPAEGRRLQNRLLTLRPRHFKGSPTLKPILDDLFTTFENTDFAFRKTALRTSLVRFLLAILECARCSPKSRGLSPEILTVQSYIEARLSGTAALHLADLAVQAGMSLSRFKARFRQETGLPPAEYVLRSKVARAVGMLANGRTVTEVAYALGFSSSQHFATVFRRFTGQPPSKLRRVAPVIDVSPPKTHQIGKHGV